MSNITPEQIAAAKHFLVQEGIYNHAEIEHFTAAELVNEYRLALDNLDELQAISDPVAKSHIYDNETFS